MSVCERCQYLRNAVLDFNHEQFQVYGPAQVDTDKRHSLYCDKCSQFVRFLTSRELSQFKIRCDVCGKFEKNVSTMGYESNRCYYNGDLLQLNSNECLKNKHTICHNCINTIGYHIIPNTVKCDLCHSPHELIDIDDLQSGVGLCGQIRQNVMYDSPYYHYHCIAIPTLDQNSNEASGKCNYQIKCLDGFIIDCEYGSKYDACCNFNQFIHFTDKLPDNIKEGMMICDDCIDKLIKDNVCQLPKNTQDE